MLLSIVICTHNRAPLLDSILTSLGKQTYVGDEDYEVIVVNNRSTDHTEDIIAKHQPAQSVLRSVLEPELGVSHARNRGWQTAGGRFVAYFDDDCIVPEGWLSSAVELVYAIDDLAVAGGPYYPHYHADKPDWFPDSIGTFELGDKQRPLQAYEFLAGGNMIVERALLEEIGGFQLNLGMWGNKVWYGEETYLIESLRRAFPNRAYIYAPQLAVLHLVRPEKMRKSAIIFRYFLRGRAQHELWFRRWFGESRFLRMWIRLLILLLSIPAILLIVGYMVFVACAGLIRNRQSFPHYQQYLLIKARRPTRVIGHLYANLLAVLSSGKLIHTS